MAYTEYQRQAVERLFKNGMSTGEISVRCKIPKRTVQRWTKGLIVHKKIEIPATKILKEQEESGMRGEKATSPLSNSLQSDNSLSSDNPTNDPLPDIVNSTKIDLDKINLEMARDLLSVTSSAIKVIEDILLDQDTGVAHRLQAARLAIAAYSSLDSKSDGTALTSRVLKLFGLDIVRSGENDQDSEAVLLPWRVANLRREENRRKVEETARLEKEKKNRIEDYNSWIAEVFQKNNSLPRELSEDFDLKTVIEYLDDELEILRLENLLRERNIPFEE